MKYRLFAALTLAFGLMAGQAQAGLIVHFDMDLDTAGIQDTRLVTDANPFDVGLVFEITDTTTLAAYNFNVRLDSAEATVTGFTYTSPTGWFNDNSHGPSNGNDDPFFGDYQEYGPIGSATVPALFPALDAGIYNMATFTLTPGAVSDLGGFDLYVVDDPGNVFQDETFADLNPTLNVGSLAASAVPEPSTFVALGVCCGSGVVVRYRRRRAAAKA